MEKLGGIFHYLANLEWTERVQHTCIFCDRANFAEIAYEDDVVIAVVNRRLAGQYHWLIMPTAHGIRDIEGLDGTHLPTLQAMERAKKMLLEKHCNEIQRSEIVSGFHRGRRPLWRNIFYPDIVSVHHLHLHVIVRPRLVLRIFKYPAWCPLMWKSDDRVFREVRRLVGR
ncbi:hypothetical protein GGS21DRAFT_309685 [Xylaria nigripes]|nr:hypothetical protein GGS21DRAFT_309685 [Xylaria nigripes]